MKCYVCVMYVHCAKCADHNGLLDCSACELGIESYHCSCVLLMMITIVLGTGCTPYYVKQSSLSVR